MLAKSQGGCGLCTSCVPAARSVAKSDMHCDDQPVKESLCRSRDRRQLQTEARALT